MTRRDAFTRMAGPLAALLAALSAAPLMAAGNPSATGGGHFRIDGALRTFAFSAIYHKDGSASGEGVVNNRADGTKIHFEVESVYIPQTPGNVAVVGARVSTSSNPTLVGQPVVFRVQDNGEGANDPADQVSLLELPGRPINATEWLNLTIQPIEIGNIQVRGTTPTLPGGGGGGGSEDN